jgi:hypothetical protein
MYQILLMTCLACAVVDAAGWAPHDSQDRRVGRNTGVRLSGTGDFIHEPCLNCGDTTPGRYCRACGQPKGEVRVSMRRLTTEVLEDQLSINSALPRTLAALFLHPGRLTAEYSRGRIASFIAPFRLYLVASLIFFLVASVASRFGLSAETTINGQNPETAGDTTALAEPSGDASPPAELSGDTVAAADTVGGEGRAPAAAPAADSVAVGGGQGRSRRPMLGVTITGDDLDADSIDWANRFHTGIPVIDDMIAARAESMRRMEPMDAIRQIVRGTIEYAPVAMFVMLPVFALLLQVMYIRSKRYYVEHFVFALHYHAFAFLIFTVIMVLPDVLRPALLLIWLYLYLPIALKRVYGQGVPVTLVKWLVISSVYSVLVAIGMAATTVVAFLAG